MTLLRRVGRGQGTIVLIISAAIVAILVVAVLPFFQILSLDMTIDECLDTLRANGYVAYANPQNILYVEGLSISGSPPITLTGDAKTWIEFRPELDFDIVRKGAVPLSYERGIFTGFELPIYADDFQELIFEICVPDRWDGVSTTHIHLDVYLISAQDDGDAFRLQVDYNYYDGGVDVVPSTSIPIELETPTGASVAFQSFHVHFDVPAGNMLGDDILAFRLRRIAVVTGNEIDGNIVFNHAGVIFLCNKYGNPVAD